MFTRRIAGPAVALALMSTLVATAAGTLQTPEQFLGFKVGADNKLARWDRIVDYMKLAAANSDRVRVRELGPTSKANESKKTTSAMRRMTRSPSISGGPPAPSANVAASRPTSRPAPGRQRLDSGHRERRRRPMPSAQHDGPNIRVPRSAPAERAVVGAAPSTADVVNPGDRHDLSS